MLTLTETVFYRPLSAQFKGAAQELIEKNFPNKVVELERLRVMPYSEPNLKFGMLGAFITQSDKDKLVGICGYELRGYEPDDTGKLRPTYMIGYLAVDPTQQGNGFGTDLFEATIDCARDQAGRPIISYVLAETRETANFYIRRKFVPTKYGPRVLAA
jgi:GNAT superfamily N-acetyltransferase